MHAVKRILLLLLLVPTAFGQSCPADPPPNNSRSRCGNILISESDCIKMSCCWTKDFFGINCFENPNPKATTTVDTTTTTTTTTLAPTTTTTTTLKTTRTTTSSAAATTISKLIKDQTSGTDTSVISKGGIIIGSIAGGIFALGLVSFLYYSISTKRNIENQNAVLKMENDDHTRLNLHDNWLRNGSISGSPSLVGGMAPVYQDEYSNYSNYQNFHQGGYYPDYQQNAMGDEYYEHSEYAQYAPQFTPRPPYQ